MIAGCATLGVLAIAAVAGKVFQEIIALRGIALFAVSVPITVAGYAFLRNDELEPHRGQWLWVRATICGLGFTCLWIAYWFIPVDLRTTAWSWFFIAPILLSIGGGIAWACYRPRFRQRLFADLLLRGADGRAGMAGRPGNAVGRDPVALVRLLRCSNRIRRE